MFHNYFRHLFLFSKTIKWKSSFDFLVISGKRFSFSSSSILVHFKKSTFLYKILDTLVYFPLRMLINTVFKTYTELEFTPAKINTYQLDHFQGLLLQIKIAIKLATHYRQTCLNKTIKNVIVEMNEHFKILISFL